MNLAEVMAGALVLATASSSSLQIWAGSVRAHLTLEQRQQLLLNLDGALLAAQARLHQPLAANPGRDCAAAATAIASTLAEASLPAGVQRQLEVQSAGVWLRLQAESLPLRQRWLDAAALGHCAALDAPTPPGPVEPPSDGESIPPAL